MFLFCVKGTYVLQDNNFQLLTQMSDGKQYTEDAPKVSSVHIVHPVANILVMCHNLSFENKLSCFFLLQFLAFPVGLIRGALSNLGLTCSVSADVLSMPKCTYMVRSIFQRELINFSLTYDFVKGFRHLLSSR